MRTFPHFRLNYHHFHQDKQLRKMMNKGLVYFHEVMMMMKEIPKKMTLLLPKLTNSRLVMRLLIEFSGGEKAIRTFLGDSLLI